tara:strand:+ start:614 stop:823 length:210 start_codon:yes stop_codon:yes gene_type:complete
MGEEKVMLCNAKNASVGFIPRVRKEQERKTLMDITEDVKYLCIFITLYAYWQVCLWILGKNLKLKSERL